ncbi:hypothetical protein MFLAVUS_000314 [Mucor flavus]|uniref:ubiquitinyl hydrolase 1 n=1 Tax=Mucor flavus TaxID=439312 RepID=A0ABP9YJC4_9FUNG
MSESEQEFNLLIDELSKKVTLNQPKDVLQFCATFFLQKLQHDREDSRQDDLHPLAFSPDFCTIQEDEDVYDEERDTVPEEIPDLSGGPCPISRGRRTSVSAESLQPSLGTHDFIKVVNPKSALQRDNIRVAIESNFLFKNLDEEQYTDVVDAMVEKEIKAGDHVINQGAVGDYFYIVESGQLDCFIDGKKVTSYGPGGSFGELALMYNAPRAASIVAVTDGRLYALDRVTFRSILMENTARKRRMYERFLEEIPLFKSLETYERHKIADALEPVQFDDNDVVIREGDVGDNFYLIESGEAKFYKLLPDGSQQEVMVGKKGEYFGELALLHDEPRAASVVAHGKLKCATLGKKAFNRLLGSVMDILKRNSENYHAVLQQSNYFTAVDLAEIGQGLDAAEQAVGGRKRGSESQNYDDSGYFSIQVLQKALEIWNLELIPWKSKEMEQARKEPNQQNAYICNLRNHWFTLRKFSQSYRWYNLDSMQEKATYLGENYLSMMLNQIEAEGYSIFAVKGKLNDSVADRKARTLPNPGKPEKIVAFSGQGHSLSSSAPVIEEQEDDEETMLAKAIQASMETVTPKNNMDEIRKKRLARFG